MNTEYDPKLQALFAQAEQEFDDDAFTREVMGRVDRGRRTTVLLWSGLGVVGITIVALLAGPLTAAVGFASQLLPVSLVDIETRWLQLLLSPINSVAAAIAIGALLVRRFFRWIFR